MTRTFFILAGFKHSPREPQFDWLEEFLKSEGFKVVKVDIHWRHRVMTDYVQEFEDFFEQHKTGENYVLGFSYGAMIAMISASKLSPDGVYLCSLSPYFQEDLEKLKPWWRAVLGLRRLADFKNYSAREISKGLKIPTIVFYGTAEAEKYPELKTRCEETAKLAQNSKLIVVHCSAQLYQRLSSVDLMALT